MFVIICVLYCRVAFGGIQPERLNAEGFSPSAFSRGLSVSATPGIPAPLKKASGGREISCHGSRFSRSSHYGGRHDTEGYASLHPRLRATRFARAFDLSGRATLGISHRFYGFFFVVVGDDKRVTISLSEAASRLVGITLAVMRLVGNFVAVIGGGAAAIWASPCRCCG